MEEGQVNPQNFDGWDDTPSYDGSQTNAIKCFSDIFQQQIKTNKCSQQYSATNKNSPKTNKINATANICLTDEDCTRQKKQQNGLLRKESNEQEQKLAKIYVVNQASLNAKPYKNQLLSNGVQESLNLQVMKEVASTVYQNTQSQLYQEIDNNQIFMKKNIFQDRSQRNQSLDSTSNFYNCNNSASYNLSQIGKRSNMSSIRQSSETSSIEGRGKIIRNKKMDYNSTLGSFNNNNLSILKTNYDDKSQYTFLSNIMNDTQIFQQGNELQKQIKNPSHMYGQIQQIPNSQQFEKDKKLSNLNLTELSSQNNQMQKDNSALKQDTILLSQTNCSTSNQNTIINSIANDNNKQVLLSNNILIMQPEKFVPFHKQNENLLLTQDWKNKKSLINQQKVNNQNLFCLKIPGVKDQPKIDNNSKNICDDHESQQQDFNDLTNSYRQHKINLQIYRNQIKNHEEDKIANSEIKLDQQIINNFNESSAQNFLKKYQEQPRLSQRPSQEYKKQNDRMLTKSSSPSNRQSDCNTIANNQIDYTLENEFNMSKEENKESFTLQQLNGSTQNQNQQNDYSFKVYQKEEKLFTVQSYFKYKDQQTNQNNTINQIKLNTDQGTDQLIQLETQRNHLANYNGIFRQTITKFNYKPRKNKSVEHDIINQIQKSDNIFYYQQEKLPSLKYQKQGINDLYNIFNNKSISSSRQKQSLNTNRSKEKLNASMNMGSGNRRSSNHDFINPIFRTPQQDKKIKQQRLSTAIEVNRNNQIQLLNQLKDKRSTPIKAFNSFTNTVQQFRRANQLTKNQGTSQKNSQIVQLGGNFDNSNPIQSFLLTNYKRSPSMEQQEQLNYINKETNYNNNFQNPVLKNRFNCDTIVHKENQAQNQKNVLRTTTNNFTYQTISPN